MYNRELQGERGSLLNNIHLKFTLFLHRSGMVSYVTYTIGYTAFFDR